MKHILSLCVTTLALASIGARAAPPAPLYPPFFAPPFCRYTLALLALERLERSDCLLLLPPPALSSFFKSFRLACEEAMAHAADPGVIGPHRLRPLFDDIYVGFCPPKVP